MTIEEQIKLYQEYEWYEPIYQEETEYLSVEELRSLEHQEMLKRRALRELARWTPPPLLRRGFS